MAKSDTEFDPIPKIKTKILNCPFHGKVKAKKAGDSYICSGDNCVVARTEKELE